MKYEYKVEDCGDANTLNERITKWTNEGWRVIDCVVYESKITMETRIHATGFKVIYEREKERVNQVPRGYIK